MENNTILVIDDDKNILAIIEMYLKKEQYNVKPANGETLLFSYSGRRSLHSWCWM